MRLLISAAHKSSGKTVVTAGLAAALRQQGVTVQPFKKGPDYIDAGWLSLAAGTPCYNLDFHTQSHNEIIAMAGRFPSDHCHLIEANKGLHDGVSITGEDSNAALAKLLKLPVVLILDCTGITRGVAPLVLGQQLFDRDIKIAALILNQVRGARHESKLRAALETYTDLPVVGALPHDHALRLPERHLGLLPAAEATAAHTAVERMARYVTKHLDLDTLLQLARQAPTAPAVGAASSAAAAIAAANTTADESLSLSKAHYRLGVFRDAAFSFYYPDDLEALSRKGFELVFINSLTATQLPPIDALLIGGGFPETQMRALAMNRGLLYTLRKAIHNRLPVYAECGGLMYLARSLAWRGYRYRMAGVLDFDVVVEERPQGRGYACIKESEDMPWPQLHDQQTTHPAHEFHYSRIVNLPTKQLKTAYKVLRGTGIDNQRDGIVYKNLLASYIHRRVSASHDWTAAFAGFVHQHRAIT